MNARLRPLPFLLALLLVGQLPAAPAPKLFTEGVRASEPLSPEQQQQTFHLPAGFKIQLVASEPDLRKPMNMAFDSAGRLWVTESREYPFAATNAALARDTIRIFSDFDDHGRARKVTTFATNLNIPIGIYPFRAPRGSGQQSANSGQPSAISGQPSAVSSQQKAETPQPSAPHPLSPITHPLVWKCLAWSIPHIYLFTDTDGDGIADQQEKFLGPFDHTRDTHGNQASFRRGLDGWIYATHGFNNQSRVSGRDGHEIFLPSGNVYRFRLDGSRVEHWTHGQVNPFGLTFDPLGNLYSADCHSSPLYQLLRGAHYPSFGRPHDGLGFAPTTIQHSHGSTAIGGIVHLSDPAWPAEFRDNILLGNVLTSRINRDQLAWRGSTSVGRELPDFLSCDDPWFRPVDLQYGPDGALYVADFYNRIIGHYEVPLLHPGRDRDRGRLWRITYQGSREGREGREAAAQPSPPSRPSRDLPNLTRLTRDGLLQELLGQNPTRAALAREELALRPDPDLPARLLGAARGQWHFRMEDNRAGLMTTALWLLQRASQLDDQTLLAALTDRDEPIRIHAARLLTERGLQAAAQRDNPARPASPPLPADPGRGEGEKLGSSVASDSLSLHRMRGEGRGEGLPAAAQVAPPLIRPAATFSPPPRKGEGERPTALGSTAPSPITYLPSPLLAALRLALADPSAHVARAAADALAANPHPDNLPPLLALQKRVPAEDTHLHHVLRLALREQLRLPGAFAKLSGEQLPPADARAFATVALALTKAEAATYLLRHVQNHAEPAENLARYITHAARYAPDADLPQIATLARQQFAADLDTQAALFKAMLDGQAARADATAAVAAEVRRRTGDDAPKESASSPRRLLDQPDLLAWGTDLARQLLAPAAPTATWTHLPLNPAAPGRNPFALEERTSADGLKTRLMSSFPHGETLTGVLRSPVFVLPKQLSFYLCGHDGVPPQPAGGKNFIRLRLVKDTDKAEVDQIPTALDPLSLHRMRGEGRGEGLPAAAQVAPPLIRPAATFSPPPRKGEGEHPPALGSFQPAPSPERPPFSPRRMALPTCQAGEAIAGEEPCPQPVSYLSHPAAPTSRPVGCTEEPLEIAPSQPETTAGRIGEPPGRRRDVDPTRLALDPTRRDVDSTRRGVDSTRRDADSTRRDVGSTRLDIDSTRLDLDSTRRDVDSTRRGVDSTRPDLAPTRLGVAPIRRDLDSTRREADSTRREDDSTRPAGVPTRLADAPAAGALPPGVVREAKVPRNDTAQKITWDLADLAGQRAVIEVTDGDDGKAYAWLAFGRFAPALPELALHDTQGVGKRQLAGAELARSLQLAALEPAVAKLFIETTDASVRAAAGRAWLSLNAPAALPHVEPLVREAAQPENLRAELAAQLGQSAEARALAVVVAALTNAPSRLQLRFATALVSTAAGAEQLLAAAESGRIAARLLQDRTLTDRLRASPAREAKERLAALVKNLPAADVQLQKLIEAKRAEFRPQQASATRGAEVFTKACVACHQLAGQGALVGPQLDGIGGRGLERLLEDILDPNRNVDKAFRTTVFVLTDGETVSGLARREEGGAFIYALANGQEARVPKAEVKERCETETSLMPANFHEALSATELNDLLAFLLAQPGK